MGACSYLYFISLLSLNLVTLMCNQEQGRTQEEGMRGLEPPLNGNRLSTNLLLTFVKSQNNSADAYIAIQRFRL